jgi:hypothetical protein
LPKELRLGESSRTGRRWRWWRFRSLVSHFLE